MDIFPQGHADTIIIPMAIDAGGFRNKTSKNVNNGNKIIWEKDKKTLVILQDVSTVKDPGIKLVFSKKD